LCPKLPEIVQSIGNTRAATVKMGYNDNLAKEELYVNDKKRFLAIYLN
jgi:hypothetical protein